MPTMPPDTLDPLRDAVASNDLDRARRLLEAGVVPDGHALYEAICRRNAGMTKLLLSFGADPDARLFGGPPLMALAKNSQELLALFPERRCDWHRFVADGDLAGLRAALDAGASIDALDVSGTPAIVLAAHASDDAAAQLLLERGANANTSDWQDITALMHAVTGGHTEMVRTLIEHGASVAARDRWGYTPILMAAMRDNAEVRDLLPGAGAEVGIVEAACLGDVAAVEGFLAGGIPVDTQNQAGMTALMAAACRGNRDLAELLLCRGATPEPRDTTRATALFHAVENASVSGDTEIIALLLDYGADINARGRFDAVPLSCALAPESASVARFLLERGADPNASALESNCPLLHAAIRHAIQRGSGDLKIVELLLEFDADPDIVDSNGWTPLMVAGRASPNSDTSRGNGLAQAEDVVRLLIARGAKVDATLRSGAS